MDAASLRCAGTVLGCVDSQSERERKGHLCFRKTIPQLLVRERTLAGRRRYAGAVGEPLTGGRPLSGERLRAHLMAEVSRRATEGWGAIGVGSRAGAGTLSQPGPIGVRDAFVAR